MGEAMEDIARRAVACKHWRWEEGMLDADSGSRCIGVSEQGEEELVSWEYRWACHIHPGWISEWDSLDDEYPDLDDPATIGCLLALVREAWGVGVVAAEMTDYSESYDEEGGRFEVRRGTTVLFRASGGPRSGRLVAALEAAP